MWVLIPLISLLSFWILYQEYRENKLLKTVTNKSRGTRTERKLVLQLLKYGIPAQTIFHDLYVKMPNGKFSQIDLAVATKVGIFVFEVKDYSGWIFGSGYNSQWTQVLAYGNSKFRFYNPIMQNSKHISDLKGQLKQFEAVPFYSIIVFYGNCTLKGISNVPGETYIIYSRTVREVLDTLLNTRESARYTNKHEIVRVLKEAVENGENRDVRIQHVQDIREMLGKNGAR
jgi:Nuclease-related domain